MNAFGTTSPGTSNFVAFGLQVVVDTNFNNTSNGTLILGDTLGFEIFEQTKGFLRVQDATVRGHEHLLAFVLRDAHARRRPVRQGQLRLILPLRHLHHG